MIVQILQTLASVVSWDYFTTKNLAHVTIVTFTLRPLCVKPVLDLIIASNVEKDSASALRGTACLVKMMAVLIVTSVLLSVNSVKKAFSST